MKLITHNMLKCNIKSVENGYPLKIEPTTTVIIETNFDLGSYFKFLKLNFNLNFFLKIRFC